MIKTQIPIKGMHCRSCELLVADELEQISGVKNVQVDYRKKQAIVECSGKVKNRQLEKAITAAGYEVGDEEPLPWVRTDSKVWEDIGKVIAVVAMLYLMYDVMGLGDSFGTMSMEAGNLSVIFLVGLTAGISTCIALVGGIVLSAAAKFSQNHPGASGFFKFRPHLAFNVGRVTGFFVLGGVVGLIGSAFALSPVFSGMMTVLIGAVMVLLGLQLTGLFPRLEEYRLSLPAGIGKALGLQKVSKEYSDFSTAGLGAASFFIPCGFTQSIQLLAMSTGGFVQGGLIMAVFALGTMPGLLGVGGIAAFVKGESAAMFYKFAGVVVILFAVFNINNGLNLTGFKSSLATGTVAGVASAADTVAPTLVKAVYAQDGLVPRDIRVQAGVPTTLEIDVQADGVGCMSSMMIPGLDNKIQMVRKGTKLTYNFTPTAGEHLITCSMGMLHGSIQAS